MDIADYKSLIKAIRVASVMTGLLLIVSCATTPPPRPLTEKENAVKLEIGEQAVTLQLKARCKPVGKIVSLGSDYAIKVHAVEIGANTAQVLYGSNINVYGVMIYDVRFWSCP